MLVLIAIGWFIGDPGSALDRPGIMWAGVCDFVPLMLAKTDWLRRGDMFKSGVKMSGGVLSERVVDRQSAEACVCGEPIADWRLLLFCWSTLLA